MSSSLHPIERKILEVLPPGEGLDFDSLLAKTNLNGDQVRRALQWLSSKGFVKITEKSEGKLEVVRQPPEILLLRMVVASPQPPTIDSLRSLFKSPEEFSAAFGRARGAGWVKVEGEPTQVIIVANKDGPMAIEALLSALSSGAKEETLPEDQARAIPDLLRRGVLRRSESKSISISLTEAGTTASSTRPQEKDFIERLSPEALASGSWKGKSLRPIDVEAKAPVFYPGRRHPVRDFIREVREAYISMGFTELQGNSVQPAFWNFDALFIPQDHPGREMQDTFYIEGLEDGTLVRRGLIAHVASTHEDGWRTGSKGWGYTWRIEEARRLVLRTHNTVLSVRALAESKEKETRVFAVSKVYRNENLDYKHLAEFYQMDGIIVGEGLNVRHLMGFLKEFYKKLGMKDVKLWPTYFPYTEPSLEVVGYSEITKSWIELSGSGIFRPEVTVPLGVKVPVLAWGPGIERLMLMRFGLDDMRALYGGDLSWLRNRVDLASSKH